MNELTAKIHRRFVVLERKMSVQLRVQNWQVCNPGALFLALIFHNFNLKTLSEAVDSNALEQSKRRHFEVETAFK